MLKNKVISLIFISINLLADPWVDLEDNFDKYNLEVLEYCGLSIKDFSYYPLPLTFIYHHDGINIVSNKNDDLICKRLIDYLQLKENYFHKGSFKIEIQQSSDEIFFQDKGKRILSGQTISIEKSQVLGNLGYKIRVNDNDNEINFDESYIAYKLHNAVFYYGRVSKWWSPSSETSLILSNNSRPMKGLTIMSYSPIRIKSRPLQFLGTYNFEFFINKLEKDRHIPEPYMIGQRISFNPNNNLSFALFRTGFLGSSIESISSDDIINFAFGSDINGNSKMNHLAGIDFNYTFKNSNFSRVYGQIVGEDESNLIPSKHIYLFGVSLKDRESFATYTFELENIDEDGKDNVYQHSYYKSGYKYLGKSIGSSSDNASKSYNFIYTNNFYNLDLKIKSYIKYLNSDNNPTNLFINGPHKIHGMDFKLSHNFKGYNLNLLLSLKNGDSNIFDNKQGISFIISKEI